LKRALSGAWYESMALLEAGNAELIKDLARSLNTTTTGINRQLADTQLFYDASSASEFINSQTLKTTLDKVRVFLKKNGRYGTVDSELDSVGIQFSDNTVMGDANNIKLKITDKYSTATN